MKLPNFIGLILAAFSLAILNVSLNVRDVHADDKMVIFAAASLKNALDEVALEWQNTGHDAPSISYASSGKLARQIEHGAPATIFISANVAWMDFLEKEGLLDVESRRDLLTNELVLIAHDKSAPSVILDKRFDMQALLGDELFAMAMVNSVPAGIYGKEALKGLGFWNEVEKNLVQTDNVRAALALVVRGEAGFGVVYKSDAMVDARVREIASFPKSSYPEIVYPVAMVKEFPHHSAKAFMDYLFSVEATAIFKRYGFGVSR